ncbi:hypothetical protein [Ideonella sp. YS5]|uniref:hypothetical protein n=1 Tax=Ideonella sp. YS5 TaxID=3453714 RepID=UPI003EE880D5
MLGLSVNSDSVVRDGVIWQSEWTTAEEGPYTRLAKIVIANAEDHRFACRFVLAVSPNTSQVTGEFHPRTLLFGNWIGHCRSEAHAFAPSLRQRALDRIVGPWWRWLACDDRLRYCRSCLSHGHQSALAQISAIQRCPVHGELLRDTCSGCGAPAPRYAVDGSFDAPLVCSHCGDPIAGGGHSIDFAGDWEAGAAFDQGHAALAQHLSPLLTSNLVWEDVGRWWPSAARGTAKHKCAVFNVLRAVLGLRIPQDLLAPRTVTCVQVKAIERAPIGGVSEKGRLAITKAIRRHLLRALPRRTTNRTALLSSAFQVDGIARQVIAMAPCSPRLHASLIWMLRFGAWPFDEHFRWQRYARIELPNDLLMWPGQMQVTDASWGAFAWSCLLADEAAAIRWHNGLRAHQTKPPTTCQWMQLSNELRAQTSALTVPTPLGVAMLFRMRSTGSGLDVWLARECLDVSSPAEAERGLG